MKGLLDFAQSASNAAASNVSVPVDLLAWALRKAGVPVGDAPVGSSAWMAQKGLTREVPQSAASLAGETFGLLAPGVVAAKAPQIAAAANKAIANAQAPRTLHPETGAIVWHGSPHKFDRFDSSKIGTGEGAQAYGHGLYLAEAPATAQTYATANRGRGAATDGLLDSLSPGIQVDAMQVLNKKDGPIRDAMLDELMKRSPADAPLLQRIKAEKAGNLYKVDLPDTAIARMLDWDKPLSQQAEGVQKALKAAGVADIENWAQTGLRGSEAYKRAKMGAPAKLPLRQIDDEIFAANRLRDAGIPGIRYLDGGSRNTGLGTSNFVVFPGEESMLTILERNGKGLLSP